MKGKKIISELIYLPPPKMHPWHGRENKFEILNSFAKLKASKVSQDFFHCADFSVWMNVCVHFTMTV